MVDPHYSKWIIIIIIIVIDLAGIGVEKSKQWRWQHSPHSPAIFSRELAGPTVVADCSRLAFV